MSSNWVSDIAEMHDKFGVNKVVRSMDADTLKSFLEFRIRFLQEELDEMKNTDNMEDVTDALIDLCVVAIGTLDALDIDAELAWYRVHRANMAKQVGIKASRPNPLGLPDLIKPEGWVAPSHADNIGLLRKL
jgi:predicted HAD superfamily Cof-like phosphohydrolase